MTRSLEDVNHVVAMAEFLAHLGCRQLLPPSRKRDNLCFGAILLTVHRRTNLHSGALVRVARRWETFGTQRRPAVIHGSQGGRRLAAESPAP